MVKRNPAKEQKPQIISWNEKVPQKNKWQISIPPSTSMFFSDVVVTTHSSIFRVPSLVPSHATDSISSPKRLRSSNSARHKDFFGTQAPFWDHGIWAVVVVELFFLEGRFGQEEW